ncbi:MAG: formyltetrahydrofolate deformylase [Acidimicrobiia bacterium]|nr:formyltetrahydrofolate deformylase [Acidimicrobiia bacterium]
MKDADLDTYILRLSCPDRPGIVYAVSGALLDVDANILENSQYDDLDTGLFTLRTRFETERPIDDIEAAIGPIATELQASYRIRNEAQRPRVLIMVSRYDHCLIDLLYRWSTGELPIEIPLVVSNHTDTAHHAARYGVRFEHLPMTPDVKEQQERRLVELVDEQQIDFVVLARYMQILSPELCAALSGRIINIHHSFLPGFKGARPYHQAHERGVKLIGATAHYVTSDLDEGPIIEQDVERVNHSMTPAQLTMIGQDIERRVLARAVRYHAEDRVILIGGKTVVFS